VSQSPRVIVSVTGFRPPHDGGVQAIVKVQTEDGQTEQEIGRFGIFPNAEFKAVDPPKLGASACRCPRRWPAARP
jgi:hypothetical protein